MDEIYVLQHEYELAGHDEYKFIGVYSSREKAESVVAKLVAQPGFRDHPDGFCISACKVDGNGGWPEGFSTMTTIAVEVRTENGPELRCVEAELLPGDVYEITTMNQKPESEQWAFNPGDTVRCEGRAAEDGTRLTVAVESVWRAVQHQRAAEDGSSP